MKTYLGSDEFQRYKEYIEGKRAREESQIKLIYREVSLDENNLERGFSDENMQNFSDIAGTMAAAKGTATIECRGKREKSDDMYAVCWI